MLTDILLFLVGIVVGAMNAIAGGGILLGFPVLMAAGLPPLVANATSNIVVLPGQFSSVFGYRKYLRKVPRHYLLLIIPCLVGAVIGALILRNTSSTQFEQVVPVLIAAAVILFAIQPLLHFNLRQHLKGKIRHAGPLVFVGWALLPVGIYGGYFGAGFGFIMLAFLGFTKLKEVHQMNALKNVAAASIAGASIVCLLGTGLIDWRHGLVMAGGNFIGGYLGAILAQKISSHKLRIVVIVIGVLTAGYLAFNSYR